MQEKEKKKKRGMAPSLVQLSGFVSGVDRR